MPDQTSNPQKKQGNQSDCQDFQGIVAGIDADREYRAASAIVAAIRIGDELAYRQLACDLSQKLHDEELLAIAYACILAAPADKGVWLVRDLFQFEPFPFSDPKAAKKQIVADAKEWAADCSPFQLKAYAAEIVKAMPRTDRKALGEWIAKGCPE